LFGDTGDKLSQLMDQRNQLKRVNQEIKEQEEKEVRKQKLKRLEELKKIEQQKIEKEKTAVKICRNCKKVLFQKSRRCPYCNIAQ
jgi:hypothetical protein